MIYDVISWDRIKKVIPFFDDVQLEQFLVDSSKHRFVKVSKEKRKFTILGLQSSVEFSNSRSVMIFSIPLFQANIDHREKCVRFGGAAEATLAGGVDLEEADGFTGDDTQVGAREREARA